MTTETATPDTPLITDKQMTKLNILLKENDLSDRDEALAWISGVIGIDITSRKDLSMTEASELIDRLADGQVRKREQTPPDHPPVQEAVRRVMTDIGHIGVGKEGVNEQQRYRFRGIDQFVDSLSPILSRHGVILLPNAESPVITEHSTSAGKAQFMCVLTVHWTIVGPRGDTLEATTIGQALDTSDKSANKAMSASFKYLLAQVFAVPNIGWSEQDVDSPEAAPQHENVDDLIDRISTIAIAEGKTFEELTQKFRHDNGDRTVEELKRAPRALLNAYVSRLEQFRAQKAAQAAAQEPSPPAGYQGDMAG